jgi:hypothetical protein
MSFRVNPGLRRISNVRCREVFAPQDAVDQEQFVVSGNVFPSRPVTQEVLPGVLVAGHNNPATCREYKPFDVRTDPSPDPADRWTRPTT